MPTPAPKTAPSGCLACLEYAFILTVARWAAWVVCLLLCVGRDTGVAFEGARAAFEWGRLAPLAYAPLLGGLVCCFLFLPLLLVEFPAALVYDFLCRVVARTPGDRWLYTALYGAVCVLLLPLPVGRIVWPMRIRGGFWVGWFDLLAIYALAFTFAAVSSWLLHRRRNALFLAAAQAAALAPPESPASSELPAPPPSEHQPFHIRY